MKVNPKSYSLAVHPFVRSLFRFTQTSSCAEVEPLTKCGTVRGAGVLLRSLCFFENAQLFNSGWQRPS